ncbi:MAG: T9SS type A sorting domain-containing protein [Phaeodactylibacter sp.]|nr:T9SS type A sorting domain-containing protein [Phaeodactylibacter sp.]
MGTVIENSAAIYFDINEAVITNTTFHTLGRDFIELVNFIPDPGIPGLTIEVIPNPAGDWALFQLEGWPGGAGWFELMNHHGQAVQQRQFSDSRFRFERSGLPAGLYFFRITDEKGRWMTGKVVLK